MQQNTGLIGLVSVVVAIIFFFIRIFNEKKKLREEVNERIIRICNVILDDVQYIENDLVNEKYQKEIYEKEMNFFLCVHQRNGLTYFDVAVLQSLLDIICRVEYGSTAYTDEYRVY